MFLCDIDLAVVHEVEDGLEVSVAHTLHVEKRMLMSVPSEDSSEEWRTRRQDDFMGLQLILIACQSHIKKVFFLPYFSKSRTDICLKIIPPETELL